MAPLDGNFRSGARRLVTPLLNGQPILQNEGGVYVHVPFCSHKCPYCHFFVLPHEEDRVRFFLDHLKKEWALKKELFRRVKTLYIGGGTPSLLSVQQVEEILNLFDVEGEITLEANPENITYEKLKGFFDLGINRLSIGVQSLDDESLQIIDRRHLARKAIEGVEIAHRAGFSSISIDLMYDLPHQTLSSWEETIRKALLLPITHISLYNLVFEMGSSFYKKKKSLQTVVPSDEVSTQLLSHAITSFESAAFSRYEISAFAKKGFEARHNLSYWTGIPFLGLGPSAFSYYQGCRFSNAPHLKKWGEAIENGSLEAHFTETLSYPHNLHELLAIRLRLASGVPITDFPALPSSTLETLQSLSHEGYLTLEGGLLRLTEKGQLFYDTVASELVT